MRIRSEKCEAALISWKPITTPEYMQARDYRRKFAHILGRQDVLVSQYARSLCNRLRDAALDAVIHCGPSNFLSCDARDFGLAFCVDHALQIANEV